MSNKYKFVIVIKDIKDPNKVVSGGVSNKYKGAYKKIFDILDEDSIFVQSEVEDEKLKGNDFYLYFNSFTDFDKLYRISKIPNVEILKENFAKGGKTKGDCYLVAGQLALEIKNKDIDYKGTPYLVHAEVKHSQIEGLRYGHAFIEDDENVYDFSNNREIIMPKQLYYYFGDINPRDKKKYRKYTFKEAREKMLSTGHYGCWDIEVEYEKGGRVFNDEELLEKWEKGQSIGFTAIAHLKSKGLIPRADGIKRKSEKYMKNGGMTDEQGFIIEELDKDLKEVYQNRAYKNVGGANFFFSRLNVYPEQNVFTIELPNGMEVGRATLNEKENYLTNIRLDYDYRRRGLASNLYDYIEYVIGKKIKPSPDKISIEAQKLWLKRNPDIQFKNGGTTISQTPAPKKDQVKGSDINKKSSSKDLSSAKLIKFDDKTLLAIKNKVKEHNGEHPNKKINLSSAKAVVRRGMGAYSKSHRPTISGGKPNSRVAWGLARLNAFTYKIVNGKSKSGKYSQDDDLIEELGYKVANYENGGKMSKDIRCINCGWEWNRKDSELWDMYVCHKCGFDNTTFYTSIPINNYSRGGKTQTTSPDYLKMFLDL
jgi:hypothetical protein